MNIPTITTERVRLRPFTLEDTLTMHQIINGKDVLKYFPGSKTVTEAQVQRMIERIQAHWQENGYGLWATELRASGALLGRCGLQHLEETDEVEIDFIFSRDYWGNGFATEAGRASLQYGFERLDLQTIVGIVHPENLASQRVLEKIEMAQIEKTEYFGMACFKYEAQQTEWSK